MSALFAGPHDDAARLYRTQSELAKAEIELRTLRRELAARRAVDGWLESSEFRYLEVGSLSRLLNACEIVGGTSAHILVAAAPDYPALATALGLDWEKTDG